MLLSCARKRMNGPRFLPSGSRLGPYFCKRVEASLVSRPFSVLVVRRFSTSSTVMACQAVAEAADLEFTAASIQLLPFDSIHPGGRKVIVHALLLDGARIRSASKTARRGAPLPVFSPVVSTGCQHLCNVMRESCVTPAILIIEVV